MFTETNLSQFVPKLTPNQSSGVERSFADEQVFLEPATINDLYRARDRLREFATQLGDMARMPIREDVLAHCDKVKENKKEMFCFDRIEKMVKNRIQKYFSPQSRMIKNKKIKKNWGQEDVYILIWVVSKHADFKGLKNVERELVKLQTIQNNQDWNQIAELIPGVAGEGCMFKWLNLKRNKLSDNNWSEKESLMLDRLVKKYGDQDWGTISEQLYYISNSTHKVYRCPKQCREHWNCYLNPNLKKGPWELEEDLILLTEIRNRNGQKRWTELLKYLNGRTQNALKNRYNLIIEKEKGNKKQLKNLTAEDELKLVNSFLQKHYLQKIVSSCHTIGSEENKPLARTEIVKTQLQESEKDLKQIPEKRVLRKRKNRKKMLDCPYEEQSDELVRHYVSPRAVLTTPRIHENHILQFNSLESTPLVFNSHFQKASPQRQFQSPHKIMSHFQEDIKKQTPSAQNFRIPSKKDTEPLPQDLEKIQFVSLKEGEIQKFKELVLRITNGEIKDCSFVPCQISENKLTKFSY